MTESVKQKQSARLIAGQKIEFIEATVVKSDDERKLSDVLVVWAMRLGFYITFYTFLFGFTVGLLSIVLSNLSSDVPRYYGKGSIIGVNPGVGYKPWLIEDPESTLIRFNASSADTYQRYIDVLKEHFDGYAFNGSRNRHCASDESNSQMATGGSYNGKYKPCHVNITAFNDFCTFANDYGFKYGKPCVVLTLNRMIGWEPESFQGDEVPENVKGRYLKNNIAMFCDGRNAEDKEYTANITYFPASGIDGRFYPYVFVDHYQQPFAVVSFKNLPKNKLLRVECRAYAKNIEHSVEQRIGLVHFELLEDK